MRTYGIDLSYVQREINWEKIASLNSPEQPRVDFVYAKCTSGVGHDLDLLFHSHIAGARGISRLTGAYQWWVWFRDPVGQAAELEEAIEIVGGVELPWAIDFEYPPPHLWSDKGVDPKALAPNVLAMAREVRRRSGRRALIYTYPDFKKHLPRTEEAGEALRCLVEETDLWIASGAHYLEPRLPGPAEEPPGLDPWPSWALWQFGGGTASVGTVPVPGIAGYCDRDVFPGDLEKMYQWADGTLGKDSGSGGGSPPSDALESSGGSSPGSTPT